MSSSPPCAVPLSQETFERVFNLQRRVEPDHENHITSSFSVLHINSFNNNISSNNNTLALGSSNSKNLEIYTNRRRSKKNRLGKIRKTIATTTNAQSNDFVYKGDLTCFPPTRSRSNFKLDCNLTLPSPTTPPIAAASATPQENYYYPLATRNSISILGNSRLKNQQLQGNNSSFNNSIIIITPPKPSSSFSIYSHSLLQPICKS